MIDAMGGALPGPLTRVEAGDPPAAIGDTWLRSAGHRGLLIQTWSTHPLTPLRLDSPFGSTDVGRALSRECLTEGSARSRRSRPSRTDHPLESDPIQNTESITRPTMFLHRHSSPEKKAARTGHLLRARGTSTLFGGITIEPASQVGVQRSEADGRILTVPNESTCHTPTT